MKKLGVAPLSVGSLLFFVARFLTCVRFCPNPQKLSMNFNLIRC